MNLAGAHQTFFYVTNNPDNCKTWENNLPATYVFILVKKC